MGKTLGRQFKDKLGLRGNANKSYKKELTHSRKKDNVRFETYNTTHIQLIIPEFKTIYITKKNAIKLAHWLLDNTWR